MPKLSPSVTPEQWHALRLKEEERRAHILIKRELRKLRGSLRDLTGTVRRGIALLDSEMTKPASVERGKNIAKITNYMQFANDSARHFALHQKL